VTQQELSTALRAEAMRYPGQEQMVVEFFTKQPGAIEQLRGPIFEDKVVDHILAMAQVTDKLVAPEELALPATEAGDQPALAGFAEPDADRGVETDAALDTEPVAEMHAEAADSADAVAP
jgi:hypothetical protein